jgi:hypothetical protein
MRFSNVDAERAAVRRARERCAGIDDPGSVAAYRQMGVLSRFQLTFAFAVECKNARS